MEEVPDTLRGIELTEEGRVPQRDLVFITDEEQARILDDPVRLSIVKLLRKGVPDIITVETRDATTGDRIIRQREVQRHALSVVEIVKLSCETEGNGEITKNQVYHHLPTLIKSGYIVKYGTVTTGKRTTDYYSRTAKGFIITPELPSTQKELQNEVRRFLDGVTKNIDLRITPEKMEEALKLIGEVKRISQQGIATIAKMIKGDVVDQDMLDMYEELVDLYSFGNEEYVKAKRRLHELLFK
ncbi:MAG: hypothetical protein HXY34_02405 [Candidatus Thorarchaeota archaeon]|nr:hypothetical protein [Candidatus Thorarchaeota archaeon]